ncbi:PAS domain S-box protein [Microscilla marina]|uniref:histidine kinase n=1 Tax=Microscilla marina ATCC 23134 TaxID=313606 RepID=A1ZSZ4_MICM2|nr:PAS domain S-box protein [Microscilla marina]EAY26558.1 response Regulator Receiver Signal Transduction Histidine Kinase [Microscilla marina ATCC 23134]
MSLQKILIVEDQRIVAKDLEVRLHKLGYEVVDSVITGDAAIESARLYKPDLILMDILIEGDIDGIETAHRILAENPIPIIYLTAQADNQTFKRATESAPYGYILKPFQQREIEVTIKTVLNRARMEKVLRSSETQLRASNEKFEHFFANSLEGAAFRMLEEPLDWENHPDKEQALSEAIHNLRITKVNQAMLEQYHMTEEDFLGTSLIDLFSNNKEFIKEALGQLFTLKQLPIKAHEQRPDGSHIWVNGNTSCFLNEEGHILGVFILQRDVTREKLTQDLIQNQAQILEKIAKDSSIDKTLEHICQNIDQLIDSACCAILGVDRFQPLTKLKVLAAPRLNSTQKEALAAFDLESTNGQKLLNGEKLIFDNIDEAGFTDKFKGFASANQWKASWFIPILSTDKQLQSILMINSLRSSLPSELEWNVIKTSVSLTSLAIERHESQQHLWKQALTFANLNDALVITDHDGNIQEWNPASTNVFGYSQNEIAQKNASTIFRSTNKDTGRDLVLDALKKHGKWSGEVGFVRKDGSSGISQATVLNLKDRQNQAVGILSINRDITTQKETEQALKASEQNFQVIFDNANQVFVLLNAQSEVQTYNKKASELFDRFWPGQLKLKQKWTLLFPEEILQQLVQDWAKVTQGQLVEDEANLNLGGSRLFFSYSYIPIYNDHGTVAQVCFTATDITERKKAEMKIRESRAKLEALIENTDDGIWSVDASLNITTVNTALQKIFKTHLDNTVKIGDNLIEKLPEEFRANWQQLFEKVLSGDRINEEFALELTHTTVYFEASINPIVSTSGISRGATAFLKNISQKKERENELKRANSELDSFVYRASHDLRAPLRSILGLVSLIRIEPSSEERENYLGMMEKSAKKLDNFISDLTNLSRNSRLEMTIEEIDFEELIEETLENHQFMKDANRVQITTDIVKNGHTFYSNYSRLGIIFQNMMSNAIKYQNPDIGNPFLKIDIELSEKGATLTFTDNGRGIEDKFIGQIFDMFFRATQKSYGSGLGLYITKQAIRKIKGRVYVSSQVGQGTSFKILLPNLPEGE